MSRAEATDAPTADAMPLTDGAAGPPARLSFRTTTLVLAAGLLLGAFSLPYPFTALDTPTSWYMGQTIAEGGAPYRDAWHLRAPGTFFAHALSIAVFGNSPLGLRAFEVLWQTVTALLLAWIGVAVFRRQLVGTVAGLAYLANYFGQNFYDWFEPDGLLSLPMAFAALMTVRALGSTRAVFWLAAGTGVATAVLFKVPIGIFGVGLLALAALHPPRSLRGVAENWLMLAIGFALPLLACIMYLQIAGGLSDFLTAQLRVAPQYAELVRSNFTLHCAVENGVRPARFFLMVMVIVGVAWWLLVWKRERRVALSIWVLMAWGAAAGITLLMHGRFYSYDFFPLSAPFSVLLGAAVAAVGVRGWWPGLMRWIIAVLIAGALTVPAEKFRQHFTFARRVAGRPPAQGSWQELGAKLRGATRPQDRIFVWGNVPVVYFHSERKAASRFLQIVFVVIPWRGVDYRATLLEDFAAHPPVYLVLSHEAPHLPCSVGAVDSYKAFFEFVALQEIVSKEYRLEEQTKDYSLYRKASGIP